MCVTVCVCVRVCVLVCELSARALSNPREVIAHILSMQQ